MMRVLRTLIALGLCGWLSTSCGSAAQRAPESPAREEDADAAEGGEVDSSVDAEITEKKPNSLHDEREEPTTVEDAERRLADDLAQLDGMLSTTELNAGSCPKVCRALSSMERSVLAICELAGEGDDRCKKAREKLDGARTRVAGAQCSC